MNFFATEEFLSAAVRTATPLAFAALGECISERSGVINIGTEGAIISGALAAAVVAGTSGTIAGFAAGGLAGFFIALIFAVFTVRIKADQIITGTAIALLAIGLTGVLYSDVYISQNSGLSLEVVSAVPIPVLSSIPLIGPAFFNQPPSTYVMYILVPITAWIFNRTRHGLSLKAVGESPSAALAAGLSPSKIQFWAICTGGTLGGVAGATLVLAQSGAFVEGMSAGKGFIAIAIVVLGRWKPIGVALAALLFGAASALQFLFQSMGWNNIPYQLFLALPYILTLIVLARTSTMQMSPAALAKQESVSI